MTTVLDYMFRQDLVTLRCFKNSGVAGVARYLDPFNPKGVTKDEIADIHAAGLSVHLFFETTGGSNDPGYFTRAQGVADCLNAVMELTKIGAPAGTVVLFAVDINIEPSAVTEYANGIESVATPAITPGLYGYQRLCEYAHANYPNLGKHLAQTYGTPTVPLDLWQHLQEDRCGVSVDVNDAYVDGWRKETDMAETPEETYARIAPLLQSRIVAPQVDTDTAIKDALALLAAHQANAGDLAAGVTAQVLVSIQKVLTNTAPPVPPSCPPGTRYFGESADGAVVGFTYPDGSTHWFRNGAEIVK